jgi:hypothetical protein
MMASIRLLIGAALVGVVAGCGAATVKVPAPTTAARTAAAQTAAPTIPTAAPTAIPTAAATPVPTAVPPTPVPTPVVTASTANAAAAAAQYLTIEPFSRAGLIQQLSSSAGDGFTLAQAEYGATAAGL